MYKGFMIGVKNKPNNVACMRQNVAKLSMKFIK